MGDLTVPPNGAWGDPSIASIGTLMYAGDPNTGKPMAQYNARGWSSLNSGGMAYGFYMSFNGDLKAAVDSLATAKGLVNAYGGGIVKAYGMVDHTPVDLGEGTMGDRNAGVTDPGWNYYWVPPNTTAWANAGLGSHEDFMGKYGAGIFLGLATLGFGAVNGFFGSALTGGTTAATTTTTAAATTAAEGVTDADIAGGLIPEFGSDSAYAAGLGDLTGYQASMTGLESSSVTGISGASGLVSQVSSIAKIGTTVAGLLKTVTGAKASATPAATTIPPGYSVGQNGQLVPINTAATDSTLPILLAALAGIFLIGH